MRVSTNGDLVTAVEFNFKLDCYKDFMIDIGNSQRNYGSPTHEAIASLIAKNNWPCYMAIVNSERLDDSLWEDPTKLHKTNYVSLSEGLYDVRRNMMNRYFKEEDLKGFFKKYEFPLDRYNFKEDEEKERRLKFEVEDALFQYQEQVELFELVTEAVKDAEYELDGEGYVVFDDNDEPVKAKPEDVEKNRKVILERFLIPRVYTKHERVYDMPKPFHYWDSRSKWHQYFFVDIPSGGITTFSIGGGGSSCRREDNGRWAHVFATLRGKYGIKIPTKVFLYNKFNEMKLIEESEEFQTLRFDITGNYQMEWKESEKIMTGMIHPLSDTLYTFN